MMVEHCVIDGKLCSKCCEVLMGRYDSRHISISKKLRYDHSLKSTYPDFWIMRKISKRRAKKINPYTVKLAGNNREYFTCVNYKGGRCTDYEGRPRMCSNYPYYGKTEEVFKALRYQPEYREDCTYFINL